MSYNYGPAEDELNLCELSDKNHLQVPSDELEERQGFIYRPVTPVSKLKQRCPRLMYHKTRFVNHSAMKRKQGGGHLVY